MSYSYDRYERNARPAQSRRNGLTYWIPLALTVTVATVGIVAWIWSERNDDDEDKPRPYPPGPPGTGGPDYGRNPDGSYRPGPGPAPAPGPDYGRNPDGSYRPAPGPDYGRNPDGSYRTAPGPDYGRNPDGTYRTGPPSYAGVRPGEVAYGSVPQQPYEQQGYITRMSGALRRTPSPQQLMEGASRSVVAGVAAAGAVVGNALSSIREEDKNAYKDHRTWSEEADTRLPGASPPPAAGGIEMRSVSEAGVAASPRAPVGNGKRKTVAIVVSADINEDGTMDEDDIFVEHASILSHLPRGIDFSKIRLFVLIHAPGLKEHPLDVVKPPGSLSSSFSNIGHDQAQTPTEELNKTLASSSTSPAFNAIYAQGLGLVEKETMVLPFTTATGHVHILRHLNPETVYLQESLAGSNGDVITHLQSWLRQDVVLVVGADGGHGGLADSESEGEQVPKKEHWWEREDRVGRGRGVVVVEGVRVGDDWARRVEHKD